MLILVKKQYLQVKQGYEEAKAIGLRYSLELTEARSEAAEAARQSKQLQLQLQSSYSEMNAAFPYGSASLASSPVCSDLGSDFFGQLCCDLPPAIS
mmetsp:Transcript_33189/g.44229  ORF Transcript_33189/g.44229 Transcript_33189/m.44229 type:complete len:96 (+) Transcript_33189:499-786(+)